MNRWKRGNRHNQWKIWGLGLLVMGFTVWMSYHLGYTYIRLVTQPKPNASQSAANSEQNLEARLTLSELDFWTCQAGVFQEEDHAQQERNRLEQLGWETQIVGQKPWAVVIGLAHEQGELVSLRDLLKEGGVGTVIKHIVLPGQSYRITGKGADQTAELLQNIHEFLKTSPGKRGETLSLLEKEIAKAWPQKLDKLQQATLYVVKAERTLGADAQRQAVLRLLAEYQNTLSSLQK